MTPADVFRASPGKELHWISVANSEGATRPSSHLVTRGYWFYAYARQDTWEFVIPGTIRLDMMRKLIRVEFTTCD